MRVTQHEQLHTLSGKVLLLGDNPAILVLHQVGLLEARGCLLLEAAGLHAGYPGRTISCIWGMYWGWIAGVTRLARQALREASASKFGGPGGACKPT